FKHLLKADHLTCFHPAQAVMQRYPAAGNRSCTGAAISLNNVAVNGDLEFAQCLKINDSPQRTADQTLDFLRAATLLAAGCFTAHTVARRAWQHAIFGRNPTLARIAHPARDLFL